MKSFYIAVLISLASLAFSTFNLTIHFTKLEKRVYDLEQETNNIKQVIGVNQ